MPSLNILQPRRTCYYRNDGFYDCDDSNWHSWGRWVALAVIVVCSIICFMLIACINSRRRRRHGGRPIYGTGWMAPLPKYSANLPPGHQPYNQNIPQNGYYAPPPPAYGQQPNQAWGQPGAIPLQQPQPTYTGDYAPPTGPPPGK
ncbi:hypothetical protein CFIMG_002647RA [Ceratocystis fimbriata CBS 114723]|uniref:Protein RCR2 n=1 Tax=Ceratocystis fimbriata CBS 114723 TaxID=1035309 RepID=A0A2C5XK90_9PEZI|nr:hypothetical protein CFIMG_002647RA [Ceratocystis fimbriata CBS 114723]